MLHIHCKVTHHIMSPRKMKVWAMTMKLIKSAASPILRLRSHQKNKAPKLLKLLPHQPHVRLSWNHRM